MSDRGGGARGQATLELALVLPLVLAITLLVVQVGLVVRDQQLVLNAAREGARSAATDPVAAAARQAAVNSGDLDADRLDVVLASDAATVTVTVTYRSATDVPLVGPLLGDVTLTESVTMHRETP